MVTGSAFFSKTLIDTNHTYQNAKESILLQTTKIVGNTIGKEMEKDENGKINILLAGYGGDGHAGGYLADSIIIASFDPKEYSMAMISVPRDLIVNMSGSINKINSVMAYSYNRSKDVQKAAMVLAEKTTEITGLKTPYYVLMDFDGFSSLVNKIGGIDIEVPQTIYDRTYPGPNYSYTTFTIKAGPQHLDGATALKYARSRHSSSDFSRSQRQQLIIQSIVKKLSTDGFSVNNLKSVYDTYQEFVITNISLDEILGLLAYGRSLPPMFNFGYTYECNNSSWKAMKPACVLYPVVQEQFNGMSGMLPVGASIGKISFYNYTKGFAHFVSTNQGLLKENFSISIHNAIDATYAKQFPYKTNIAANLAIKLKRYGIMVEEVMNEEKPSIVTTAVVSGSGDYKKTLEGLSTLLTIDQIQINNATVDMSGNELSNHIDLYLGNTFIDEFGNKKFNTYLTHAE